jgi:NAD(P)-dependent dehydrogenase (short-subunit alcohol dehydrogenase family)
MTETPLAGRVAIVTGAGRGIGRATAMGLAAAGARVALTARTSIELDAAAAEIEAGGGTALAITADVGQAGEPERVASQAEGQLGAVDILVNNAAVVWPPGPTSLIVPADWVAALAINVTGPVLLTRAVLPAMLERGWGRIVNVSSGIAEHPAAMIRGNAYAATKAALEAHTVNLAAELDCSGVTVNVFRPGTVDTAMQAWIRGQSPATIGAALHARFVEAHEQGTLITPQQSAQVLLEHLPANKTGEVWSVNTT